MRERVCLARTDRSLSIVFSSDVHVGVAVNIACDAHLPRATTDLTIPDKIADHIGFNVDFYFFPARGAQN